jgi:hypothetical protein
MLYINTKYLHYNSIIQTLLTYYKFKYNYNKCFNIIMCRMPTTTFNALILSSILIKKNLIFRVFVKYFRHL